MKQYIAKRSLGVSGLEVAELGLGCNRIGEDLQSDREWIALLQRAVDLGITLFDTAEGYAGGRSEELIGRAFGNRQDVFIATKVSGANRPGEPRFPKETVMAGAENSLRALQRDCIDVFQTHGSGRLGEGADPGWAEAMEQLKKQGKIRLRGAAVHDSEWANYAIEHDLVDVLQITYNLIDTDQAAGILPVADQHGIGLLARMPYQRGILTGKFTPSAPEEVAGHRASLQGERLMADLQAAEEFRQLGENRPGGMTALAMQYVLAEQRISCTIPGARCVEQLEANAAAASAPPLGADELERIRDIRDRLGD